MSESDESQHASPLPRGCFLGACLCGFVMLGVAAYLVKSGTDLGGAARIIAFALGVIGTLLVLPFGVVMGLRLLATLSADRAIRRSAGRDDEDDDDENGAGS
jgi:hypothetical protein